MCSWRIKPELKGLSISKRADGSCGDPGGRTAAIRKPEQNLSAAVFGTAEAERRKTGVCGEKLDRLDF
jgi:hypothetical protein